MLSLKDVRSVHREFKQHYGYDTLSKQMYIKYMFRSMRYYRMHPLATYDGYFNALCQFYSDNFYTHYYRIQKIIDEREIK